MTTSTDQLHRAIILDAWTRTGHLIAYADLSDEARTIRDTAHRSLSYFGQRITAQLHALGMPDPADAAPLLAWIADDAMWMNPDPPLTIGSAEINDLLRTLSHKAERYARDGRMTHHDVIVEAYNDVAFWTHRPPATPCDCASLTPGANT